MPNKLYLCCSPESKAEHHFFLRELEEHYTLYDFDKDYSNSNIPILVIGGDGSLNYLVNNVSFGETFQVPVLYIPSGTANDFAKSLNIEPFIPSLKIIEDILKKDSKIDVPVMSCNEKFFINVLTAGAPAKVTNSGTNLLKKAVGKLSYYLQAIEELITPQTYEVTYTTDQFVEKKVITHGFIINQGLYAGGGVKVTPAFSARFGDSFDFTIPTNDSLSSVIYDIIELQKDRPKHFSLDSYECKKLKIKVDQNIPMKLDGEEYLAKELTVEKTSKSLSFYIP